jgi:hypothetical protein
LAWYSFVDHHNSIPCAFLPLVYRSNTFPCSVNSAVGIAADTGLAPKALCAYERKARAEGIAIIGQWLIK